EDQHTYTHQIFDHQELLRSVTKASFRLNVESLEEILDKALSIAFDGQRGPVHLDVPISVAKARIARPIPVRRAKIMATAPVDEEVTRLGALLEQARRPLILAGLDVLAHRAASELQSLAELLSAPVLTTYKAKGVIPETHPLSLGGAGLSPRADAVLLPLVRKADVVVLAGYDPIEMRKGWRSPFREETAVIEISSVPNTHYVHQASCSVVGDIGATLRVLGQRVQKSAGPVWDCGSPESARRSLESAFARESVFGPARISHALSELIPKHAFVSVDTGAHRIAFNQIYRVQSAGTLLQSSGLCTMGCAVPLAIGAKLAAPLRPAVAVTGDGGLEMALGELATLRDQRLGVVIVVYDDRSLALIEMKQRHLGLSTLGVNSGGTDFVSVAKSFGGIGVLVEDEATLRKAVCEALAVEGRFSLLHCRLERASYDHLI
ncbi:MAG: thiamine pyrophosphate-binding protein, partial [Myxococcota bacterium]